LLLLDRLPAIAADTDTDANARCPEADATARTVVVISVAAALDIALAGGVIIGIPNDHAAPPRAVATSSAVVTDHANRLR
jgi:hypothetical protein